ncbi:lipopolysaccharide biosynthesis protein [Sporolactobacillus laevolacticus]|uniref:lipopolysaccharide biosynthesis protein n=1 Tax=Sporolactobacillus laevolacticus TaxID=33018 RepID=UPI0025B5810A|nr:oligosaccharide flippase family protein [Sporolactobacillus laevolacticus]MDN3954784.1 polysaccharide biosynthesis C-terminal domain-containing protein [Sporolactobacillus laevolacticus]
MNKYKKLAANSLIFAIGNLGSKLIALLLIPLYTYYLSTTQYGTIDLITTTLSLLLPIFTLSIYDAVLRFAMDKGYDKSAILNNALVLTLFGYLVALLMYPIFKSLFPFSHFMGLFYLYLLTECVNSSFLQFIRAIGKVTLFASVGIMSAVVVLIGNITFLVFLHLGTEGYILSLIIADLFSCLTILFAGTILPNLSIRKVSFASVKEMLVYSIPLIPNSLMWWVMGVSDRYLIAYFIGISANGLYAVANKIPSILSVVNTVFFQAWQMSAIEEAASTSKSKFYTDIFRFLSTLMLLVTSLLLVSLKFILHYCVSAEYYSAWKYVPFLLLGVVFSSFSGFLGTNYIAAKKTFGVFRTSVIGALLNLIVNLILIPTVGVNGASLATMLSFLVMWVLRVIDTKDFVTIDIKLTNFLSGFIIIMAQVGIMFMNPPLELLWQSLLFLSLLIVSKNELGMIYTKLILRVIHKAAGTRKVM